MKGINQIKHIIDKYVNLMSHDQLKEKYNITTPFLTTFQLLSSIPKVWKKKEKKKTLPINKENIPASNSINVNNKIQNIEKTKCKDLLASDQ